MRIKDKFHELKEENKKAIIPYIVAGDPSIEKTTEIILELEKMGASIIEIGIPNSDPLADGEIIMNAGERAIKNGITLDKIFQMIDEVKDNCRIPLVIMSYFNSIYCYGMERFVDKCEEVGISGLIIPDLPLEERKEFIPYIENTQIDLIPLVAPTSKDRIKDVINGKSMGGFVYCVSSLGVTGERKDFDDSIEEYLKEVKDLTDLPIAIGFGIKSRKDIDRFTKITDGAIVGSYLVKNIYDTNGDIDELRQRFGGLI